MNIYDHVTEEKQNYLKPISIIDGWDWSMKNHLRRSFLYKNSQFELHNDGKGRDERPFNNIVLTNLNLQYHKEGFDVKDIELYVDNPDTYHKSFLLRKFHEDWATDNSIDTFIDELVWSYVDYGGVLVKEVDGVRPKVIDLQTIAFCDQTDILAGSFGILHNMTVSELREMGNKGWGNASKGATIQLEDLIKLAEEEKKDISGQSGTTNKGTSKNIEVYEVWGMFPDSYLRGRPEYEQETSKYSTQNHIIAFYKDKAGDNHGVTLFSSRVSKLPFKFLARDGGITGRALGRGGVEELFDAQTWTNLNEAIGLSMIKHASKVLYKSTDPRFKTRNSLVNAEMGQIFDLQVGTDLAQIDTTPRNLAIFENATNKWEARGQKLSGASDALVGENPSSGTPFKLQEAVIQQGDSLHNWRQGIIATFVGEIYRDWVIPHLSKEVAKGKKFLSTLSVDDLMEISEKIVTNSMNATIKEGILSGEIFNKEELQAKKDALMQGFTSGSNKRFIEIMKGEFTGEHLGVKTNIVGKQKDLNKLTDKVVNLIRQIVSTPQLLQDRQMSELLNVVLESSGLSPIFFGGRAMAQQAQLPQPQQGNTQPLQALAGNLQPA